MVNQVRPAAVAGAFYPARSEVLASEVEALLAGATAPSGPPPKAVIVPHAGYAYSGPIAATAYAAVRPLKGRIQRVVLLGPSHRVPVRGLAVPGVTAFETPLGLVPLDREGLAAVADLPQVVEADAAHTFEHSLEVQLPFLQVVLGAFRLVPLAVGDASADQVAGVLSRLWGGDETLVVVSSDLSHYLDYETAHAVDVETRTAIEQLSPQDLCHEQACGLRGIQGLLLEARRHGLRARTVDLRSSGDTAGPRDRVVGYGAWLFAP